LNNTKVRANHNTPGSPCNTFRTVSFFFHHCIALSFFASQKPRQYNHQLAREHSGHRFRQGFRSECRIRRGARVPILCRAHSPPQPAQKIARYHPTIGRLPRECLKVSLDHPISAVSFLQGIARPSRRCRLTFARYRSAISRLSSVVRKLSLDHRTAVVCRSQGIARPSHRCRLTFARYRSAIARLSSVVRKLSLDHRTAVV
jgi:hypothetical protein